MSENYECLCKDCKCYKCPQHPRNTQDYKQWIETTFRKGIGNILTEAVF